MGPSNPWALVALAAVASFAPISPRRALADGDVPTRPVARPAAYFGINEDPLWNFKTAELTTFTQMLERLGCGSLRMGLRWRVVEPQRGQWDFSAIDRALAAVPDNIQILATLMSVPQWANGMDPDGVEGWFDAYPPRNLDDWANYVFETVSRYRDRIDHWEIWNEQNGIDFFRPKPDAVLYTEILRVSYEAAKRADPNCIVVLGGLQMNGIIPNPWSDVKTPDYLQALYEAGARPYFDVANIHPYVLPEEGAEHMMDLIGDTLALMATYGDSAKPVWITEVGCGTVGEGGEQAQAQLLADTLAAAAREPRLERVFWFLLRDMEHDLLGPEGSMGLFAYSGRAKPALSSFRDAVEASTDHAPSE